MEETYGESQERLRIIKNLITKGVLRHSRHCKQYLSSPHVLIVCKDGWRFPDIIRFHMDHQCGVEMIQPQTFFGGVGALAPNSPLIRVAGDDNVYMRDIKRGWELQDHPDIIAYSHWPCPAVAEAGIKQMSLEFFDLTVSGARRVESDLPGVKIILMLHSFLGDKRNGSYEFIPKRWLQIRHEFM